MKIAILHNFMDNIGGAEKVSLILARELKADLYTTNVDNNKIKKMGFINTNIFSIGKVPINAPFRQQIALWKFRHLNLKNKYDFYIIAGDWAMSAAVNHKPNLWYVHSPIREIWDLHKFTRKNSVPWYARSFFDVWVYYNRILNRKYIKNVNKIACNSYNTQKRIQTYLGREATVIYPPIETKQYYYSQNGNFWLSVNRLISHKRIEIQLEAFRSLPDEKLIIIGSYERSRHFKQYAQFIKNHQPKNVEILSWVTNKRLVDLYANCKGFIASAHDEDFGMAVVESMASGKPIVASNEGGFRETVINGKTGVLIDNMDANKLVKAIKKIGQNPEKYKAACTAQAQKFDTKIFIDKLTKKIYERA